MRNDQAQGIYIGSGDTMTNAQGGAMTPQNPYMMNSLNNRTDNSFDNELNPIQQQM